MRYTVTVRNVKEVSLYGTADLAYWRRRLEPEGLYPFDDGGQAELVIIGAAMRWMGAAFTELSFSIAVCDEPSGAQRSGMFLVQAFNSVRAFAWVERVLFQTPYDYGRTSLHTRLPAWVALRDGPAAVFHAGTRAAAEAESHTRHEVWESGIYLPRAMSRTEKSEKLFFARLSGETQVLNFRSGAAHGDSIEIMPGLRTPILAWLCDSGFAGREWRIRASATHQKSPTYHRRALGDGASTAPTLRASA